MFPFMKPVAEPTGGKSPESKIRQNFHNESEGLLNAQINLELYASHTYLSVSTYFDRDDVALSGFSKFFRGSVDWKNKRTAKLMRYMNKRGGRFLAQDIKRPSANSWGTGLEAMTSALELEKNINQALINLHKVAMKHDDAQLASFLENEFLAGEIDAIKELSDFVTDLKKVGPGLGEFLFDKHTLK